MSDKPVPTHALPPHAKEDTQSAKMRHLCSPRYMVPLGLILFVVIISGVIFLQPLSPFLVNQSAKEIVSLKNQAADLNNRVDQLEAAIKTAAAPSITPEYLKDLETRITSASQQIEVLQNQPKVEISPQQLERSQSLEKDLQRIAQTQKILKSIVLFGRLKTKILSEAPYRVELTDFKTTLGEFQGLSFLEKYADEGLQVLKERQQDSHVPFTGSPTDSWWNRLKTMVGSFIKIEKVDAPVGEISPASRDRQVVEESLIQIDETLTQQLTTASDTPSPQPGDAL